MPQLAESTAGAIKQYIEGLHLGLAVDRDRPPPDPKVTAVKRPYVTVTEDIGMTHDGDEDGGAGQGGTSYVVELAQVDLWMDWRSSATNGGAKESRSLASTLHRAFAGAVLDLAPTRVYGVRVQNRLRLVDEIANVVQVSFTLAIKRVI